MASEKPTDTPSNADKSAVAAKKQQEQAQQEKMQQEKAQQDKLAQEKANLEKAKKDQKVQVKKEKEKIHKAEESQKRKPFRIGIGARILNLILGLIFIGVTIYLLTDDTLTLGFILSTFALLVIVIAIGRFFSVFYEKNVSGNKRLFNFLTAIFLAGLAGYSLLVPDLGRDILVLLISLALIIQGINRTLLGLFNKVFPVWYRSITFAIGIILIAIPGWVLYENDYNNRHLVLLLSYAFFFNGIGRLAKAVSGMSEKSKK